MSLCLLAATGFCAEQPARTVTIHQVPPAVKKTIEGQLGDAKLKDIEKDDTDGDVSYTVNATRSNGEEGYFTVGDDGALLAVEVSIEEAPAAVGATIKTQMGDGTVDNIEKTFEDDQIAYEVETTRKDGAARSFTISPDGKVTSAQVALEETPAAARKTIEANINGGKLGDIYRTIEDGEVSYYAEIKRDGKSRDLSVSPGGKLESIQVSLEDAPPAVQNTVREKLGDGRLLRIDKTFEPEQGVLPYSIEARKDGKPFNFSVGPRGRFLGMD